MFPTATIMIFNLSIHLILRMNVLCFVMMMFFVMMMTIYTLFLYVFDPLPLLQQHIPPVYWLYFHVLTLYEIELDILSPTYNDHWLWFVHQSIVWIQSEDLNIQSMVIYYMMLKILPFHQIYP